VCVRACVYVHLCECVCAWVCEECGGRGREKKKSDGEKGREGDIDRKN
jgi:hypothetical protein